MLSVGVARAVINPPMTIEQGMWGAKSHVTPAGIESDLWATCLVLSDGDETAVIVDLDLCLISNGLAERLRSKIGTALGIAADHVRVSATHTHAGPVLRADVYSANQAAEEHYLLVVEEQCVGIALQADRSRTPVSVQADYGHCSMGRSRRQRLDDGLMVAGFAPAEPADPTVGAVRFDTADGELVASIVHYAAHPTTLGYTNELVSPDYPGVTKRQVERTLGGTTLFLQGAAGDIGPGPGGFLSNIDVMQSIGTQLGAAASQTLLQAREKQFDHAFQELVRSGADLGVWSRTARPLDQIPLQVRSEPIALNLLEQPSPAEVEANSDALFAEVNRLKAADAPAAEIADASFRLRRSNMALQRSRNYHGRTTYDLEIHVIQFADVALVGVPIEPFSQIGKDIRQGSPYPYTLFSGYSNGANGYLPTREAAEIGGYEVDQMAVAHDSAERLTERVLQILHDLART